MQEWNIAVFGQEPRRGYFLVCFFLLPNKIIKMCIVFDSSRFICGFFKGNI